MMYWQHCLWRIWAVLL